MLSQDTALDPARFRKVSASPDFPGWVRIAVALVLGGQSMMLALGLNTAEEGPIFGTATYWGLHGLLLGSAVAVLLLLGGPLWANFLAAVRARRITMEALFIVTLLGAVAVSLLATIYGSGSVYYDVVSVVLLIYTFGNSLRAHARAEAAAILRQAKASYARAWVPDATGGLSQVPTHTLRPGQLVVVRPGELITVDGRISIGAAFVTASSLTGEPHPIPVSVGDLVQAGSTSVDGLLTIEVTSTARAIDSILGSFSGSATSAYQMLADRVVGWFLPVVGGIAVATYGVWAALGTPAAGVLNALSVLLIACPCALGIATPLAVQSFIFRLSRYGYRARSASLTERLAQADTIFFDKTGTLTLSQLRITAEVWAPDFAVVSADTLRGFVALAQRQVAQPIAAAFVHWGAPPTGATLSQLRVHPGQGISATIQHQGRSYALSVGQLGFVQGNGTAPWPAYTPTEKNIFVALEGTPAAIVTLGELSDPAFDAMLSTLVSAGYHVQVLTGDPTPQVTFPAAVQLHGGLSPQDKATRVAAAQQAGARVLFVGDGINDTLALQQAHASLALAHGSALSHAAALGVVDSSGVASLPLALGLSRRACAALRWNLYFAAYYNFIGIALAALGLLHPVVASLLMLSSSVVVAWRAMSAVGE